MMIVTPRSMRISKRVIRTDLLAEDLELQETVTVENQQRTVWVNCCDAAIPFGSYKMSGHRRGLPFLPYPQLPRMSRRRR